MAVGRPPNAQILDSLKIANARFETVRLWKRALPCSRHFRILALESSTLTDIPVLRRRTCLHLTS